METAWERGKTEAKTKQMDKDNEEEQKGEERPGKTRLKQTRLRGGRREQEATGQAGKESRTSTSRVSKR